MCEHNNRIGDNYGETCTDCGAQVRGYGYGGWFGRNLNGLSRCMHQPLPFGDEYVCTYCETIFTQEEYNAMKEGPK